MVQNAALLIEETPRFEHRDGLFYATVNVGGSEMLFVVRPHLFLAGAKIACDLGRDFMAEKTTPACFAEFLRDESGH